MIQNKQEWERKFYGIFVLFLFHILQEEEHRGTMQVTKEHEVSRCSKATQNIPGEWNGSRKKAAHKNCKDVL